MLIVFEGPDGSGKSTQIKLFGAWLESNDYKVVNSKWKSSPTLVPIIKSRKENKSLSPSEYSLLHAADFFLRLENEIVPALEQGHIVLCDRYFYTSIARDAARRIDKAWLLKLYQSIPVPDLIFYFSVSGETALKRICACREPKYYEAGQDVTKIPDPAESFRVFIQREIKEYEAMTSEYDFVWVDANQQISAQENFIRLVFQGKYERVVARLSFQRVIPSLSHALGSQKARLSWQRSYRSA